MAKILVVEDDLTFALMLEGFLRKNGYETDVSHDTAKGIERLKQGDYALLLLDYRLPGGNGLDVLAAARELGIRAPAIIMTSFNDVRTAVRAMHMGALDYITKPVNPDELLMLIRGALAVNDRSNDQRDLPGFITGGSPASQKISEYIELVAPTDMAVIIQGESGTGKEYAARAIHLKSKRAAKPFVALDCGALSKELAASELFGHAKGAFTGASADKTGQFQAAEGGTLFLDEIGNLGYDVQVKLLRALQERIVQPVGSTRSIAVDVRIIAATNDDLLNSIGQGTFRQDLYHRLNEFKISLPALRERGKDLELFTAHFIHQANGELDRNVEQLSAEVSSVFSRYDWPGNLRELRNVVRRMVLLTAGNQAEIAALPDEMILALDNPVRPAEGDMKALNEANERELIHKTLLKVNYNKSLAAKLLNVDRKTLYRKIEKYNLD